MYRLTIERSAEKDMDRLSDDVHGRVAEAISGLASNPRPPGSKRNSLVKGAVGASAWVTTESSTTSQTPCALFESFEFDIGGMFTSEVTKAMKSEMRQKLAQERFEEKIRKVGQLIWLAKTFPRGAKAASRPTPEPISAR